jgi:hypothetical protein
MATRRGSAKVLTWTELFQDGDWLALLHISVLRKASPPEWTKYFPSSAVHLELNSASFRKVLLSSLRVIYILGVKCFWLLGRSTIVFMVRLRRIIANWR